MEKPEQAVARFSPSNSETTGMVCLPEASQDNITVTVLQDDTPKLRQQNYITTRIHTAHQVFVSTEAFEFARDQLVSEHQLILLGAPGSGKTVMSLMLLRKYRKKNYDVYFIESIDDFNIVNEVDTSKSNILVFDDIFGKCGLCDPEKWMRVLNKLYSMFDEYMYPKPSRKRKAESGTSKDLTQETDLKVIFTSRSNIYKEAEPLLGTYRNTLLKPIDTVDLSKFPLNKSEKKKMLSKYKKVRVVPLDDDTIESITKQTDNIISFPCTCDMFFKVPEFQKDPLEFFSTPMVYLVNILKERLLSKKSPGQASALVLTVLGDGKLNLPNLDNVLGKLKPKWMDCLNQYNHIMSTNIVEIKMGAKSLEGTFLSICNGVHVFSHPTVYYAVGFVIGEMDINFVFEYCSMNFINEHVKLQTKKSHETNTDLYDFSINVGTDYLTKFVCRLAKELNEHNFSVAFLHEAFKKETIVDDVFEKVDKLEEVVHSTDKTHGQSFLFWATFSSAPHLVQKQIEFENTIFGCTKFKEHELLEGFLGCAISGNIRALDIIIENSNSVQEKVVSATIGNFLHAESNAEILMRKLSVTSGHSQINLHDNPVFGEKNDCLLHIASIHAHKDIVQRLLKLGCDVNTRGEFGQTPLMYASRVGHHEVADALLKAKAKISIEDNDGAGAIHIAARNGHLDVMKVFDKHGVLKNDINTRGRFGRTPLFYACRHGHSDIVQFCLENGADIAVTSDKDHCIHRACISGNLKTVQILMKHGATIEVTGMDGRTPILYASRHGNVEIVHYLMEKDAKIGVVDEKGLGIFDLSVMSGNVELAKEMFCFARAEPLYCKPGASSFEIASSIGHYDMLKYFIENHKHLVPLSLCLIAACHRGHMPIIEMLVDLVDDINEKGSKGRTALMTACLGGQTDTATFLISKGAAIDLSDEFGNNCWQYACNSGKLELVKLLLNNGFTVQSKCQNEMTSLMIACRGNHQELFEFLLDKDGDAIHTRDNNNLTCLHHCCVGKHDCPVLLERLLRLGLDVDCRDGSQKTPAMHATIGQILHAESNAEILMRKLSVTSGHSQINLHDNPVFGEKNDCLLHIASIHAHKDIVQRLLELGCDVNTRGEFGQTPLMYASRAGHHEVVDALLKAKAKISIEDNDGAGAIHVAARNGHLDVMKVFDKHGVLKNAINTRGRFGRTPLLYASRYGHSDIVQLCLENGADIAVTSDKDHCIHRACISGNLETVQILMKHGATIEVTGMDGRTPILYASRHGNIEIVHYLMEKDAEVGVVDEKGLGIFDLSVMSGNVELAKEMFCFARPEPFYCKTGGSSLEIASSLGHHDMLKYFIDNQRHLVPFSLCLIAACHRGHMPIIEMLVDLVDDINKKGSKGRTALMTACLGGQTETATFLISKGAAIDLRDEYGNNCWQYACNNGTLELVKLLLNNGFTVQSKCQNEMTSLMIACRGNHQELYEFLLKKDGDVIRYRDKYNLICLHHCCVGKHDCPVLLERLLDLGLDVNCRDGSQKTPAMHACINGHTRILNSLVDRRADLRLRDKKKLTCLHHCCVGKHDSPVLLERLLDLGLEVDCRDRGWKTPAMHACIHGFTRILHSLVDRGADLRLRDNNEKDCYIYALDNCHTELVNYIREHLRN